MIRHDIFEEEVEEKCKGCSILGHKKAFHSHIDCNELPKADVLFVSDSFKLEGGEIVPFSRQEVSVLSDALDFMDPYSYAFTAAVKCPQVKEDDMLPQDFKICRQHIIETILKVNPKIVYVCGNLALRLVTKKSGIMDKRGEVYRIEIEDKEFIVVPVYHPKHVYIEPKIKSIFLRDIKTSYLRYVKGIYKKLDVEYEIISEVSQLAKYRDLITEELTVAIDTETEGLNFLTDKILTISYSWREDGEIKTFVIPVNHKEHVWSDDDLHKIISFINLTMANPKSRKVFHNAAFDLKMLFSLGVKRAVNVWDTKIMFHILVSEIEAKGLMDLVKRYYPESLEEF